MPRGPDIVPLVGKPGRAQPNPFGILEAACGLAVGFVLEGLAIAAYHGLVRTPTTIGTDIVGFLALWSGFIGAAVVATKLHDPVLVGAAEQGRREGGQSPGSVWRALAGPIGLRDPAVAGTGSVVADYGVRLRPWPDLPLGIVVGVASQYLLVPLMELPLEPFVHNLNQQLGHPAQSLLGPVNGVSLVVLTVLVCVGSPCVEELFFRGLLMRGLLGRLAPLGPRWGPVAAITLTGLIFGLVHFERLQFLGLAGFGIVLAYLAYRTGRLGPSVVAHVAFNTTTVIAFVLSH